MTVQPLFELRQPRFWTRGGLVPSLLSPFGFLYSAAGLVRRIFAIPFHAPVPVICVGNLVVGGAGKTPVALELARRLSEYGVGPHLLTRGYGGRLKGPVRVDPGRHSFRDVGDEALLLAAAAPTWVARDRAAGARAAVKAGAKALILDDGFQNLGLYHDLDLVVVDSVYGFGNGRVFPAGPLREPLATGLRRAGAVILIGGELKDPAEFGAKPVLQARLEPETGSAKLAGQRVVAFAGIGQPEKFFASLTRLGAEIVARHSFPDHHAFSPRELTALLDEAEHRFAIAMTTEKDWVRLPDNIRPRFQTLPISVVWDDPVQIERLIASALVPHGHYHV